MSAANWIDLRSDTVTRPSAGMREAMARADVGDDVFGEDPTVRQLEETVAGVLGKQAALFMPSGTMANQVAILALTQRGDEIIVGQGAHCAWYESGAAAALGGVQPMSVGRGGLFTASEVREAIKPSFEWYPRTTLVAVENTHNRGGGVVWPMEQLDAVTSAARQAGLALHMDGARLWNASAAIGVDPSRIAQDFDTVCVCFSKGLGAPVGSALCSTTDRIRHARRLRKMLGGGMRQVGVLAAAGLYALHHHRDGLEQDHQNAKAIARELVQLESVRVVVENVQTNIVMIDTPGIAAEWVAAQARELGVLVSVFGPERIRVVTHMDVRRQALQGAKLLAQAIQDVAGIRQ